MIVKCVHLSADWPQRRYGGGGGGIGSGV